LKKCERCLTEKDLWFFSRSTIATGGRVKRCKACVIDSYNEHKKMSTENQKTYYEKNKEKILRKQKEDPKTMARIKLYYESNKDRRKTYYENNKQALLIKSRDYYNENRDLLRVLQWKYHKENPEIRAAINRNRRARVRNAEGTHTTADIKTIFTNQRGLCANCETKLFKSGKQKYHVDHIMPLALGGSNWPDNLQCLCPFCNLSKGAKHPDDWAKENGKLC
jgi:5-methylcytosine-specific restriction endonuclease McrA